MRRHIPTGTPAGRQPRIRFPTNEPVYSAGKLSSCMMYAATESMLQPTSGAATNIAAKAASPMPRAKANRFILNLDFGRRVWRAGAKTTQRKRREEGRRIVGCQAAGKSIFPIEHRMPNCRQRWRALTRCMQRASVLTAWRHFSNFPPLRKSARNCPPDGDSDLYDHNLYDPDLHCADCRNASGTTVETAAISRMEQCLTATTGVSSCSTEADGHRRSYWAPKFWHGMTFRVWLRLLARNRFAMDLRFWPVALLITAVSIVNSALAIAQSILMGRKIARTEIREPPIFFIGD